MTQQENGLSHDYLVQLVQSVPGIAVIIKKSSYEIVSINQQFETYFGYTYTELVENDVKITDLLEKELHERFANHIQDSLNYIGQDSYYIIDKLTGKNQIATTCYIYVSPLCINKAVIKDYFFLLLLPNLSKFNLPFWSFESRDIYLGQIGNENIGLFEWETGNKNCYLSDGVYAIFEADKNKNDNTPAFFNSFIHPADKALFTEAINNVWLADNGINLELKIITGEKNIKIICFLGKIFINSIHSTPKLIGSIRDITKQRLIEESYKNKVEELNNSNKELEEFAYVASHDLQEPLRKISTFTSRLAEKYNDVLKGDGAMYLERTIASAESMRILINDLLEFSRISKTMQPFSVIDLNAILRMVKIDLELIIEETQTIIETQKLPVIEGINSQLLQLFNNIISNAIKFRKQGVSPIIKIKSYIATNEEKHLRGLVQNCSYYKIVVSDNGIGFDELYATRIFQVFQRLHGKADYPGSGIGLAICKKIMEYHHGIIYAETQKDMGASFVIMIPENQQLFKK